MRRRSAIPFAALLVLASGQSDLLAASGHRQFRWTDATGIPHFSDTLTSDALRFGYDVIDSKGNVLKHVERQRTPEELLAAEAAAEAARKAQQEKLSGQRMLAAYPTEQDLVAARQAQLDSIDHNIHMAANSLGVQERGLSDLLAQAASYDHDKTPVPPVLRQQIETTRKSVDSLRGYIARRENEKVEAKKKLQEDLVRYRNARAQADANPVSPP